MTDTRRRTDRSCSFCSLGVSDFRERVFIAAGGESICDQCVTSLYEHLEREKALGRTVYLGEFS